MRGSHPRSTLANSLPVRRTTASYFNHMFVTYHGEVMKFTKDIRSDDLVYPERLTPAKRKQLARKAKYMTRALTGDAS